MEVSTKYNRVNRLFNVNGAQNVSEALPKKRLTKKELEITFNNGRTIADLVEILNDFNYYVVEVDETRKSVKFSFDSDAKNPVFISGINQNGRMTIDTIYKKDTPIDFIQLEVMRQCMQKITELAKRLYDAEFIL